MTALARIPLRNLSRVLHDIRVAQAAYNESWQLEPQNLGREIACLDRLDALQDEARAMIETATGVSWEAISGASL